MPYHPTHSDAEKTYSDLAKYIGRTEIVKLWLPYERPPETDDWYNFYSYKNDFSPELESSWSCGERLAGGEMEGKPA